MATVGGIIANGMSESDVLRTFPELEAEDILEPLRFAADAVRERRILLAGKA